jgi:hypothetical protein
MDIPIEIMTMVMAGVIIIDQSTATIVGGEIIRRGKWNINLHPPPLLAVERYFSVQIDQSISK